jgi:hypothetical protein
LVSCIFKTARRAIDRLPRAVGVGLRALNSQKKESEMAQRWWFVAAVTMLVAACGGAGDGSGGSSSGGGNPRLGLSPLVFDALVAWQQQHAVTLRNTLMSVLFNGQTRTWSQPVAVSAVATAGGLDVDADEWDAAQ